MPVTFPSPEQASIAVLAAGVAVALMSGLALVSVRGSTAVPASCWALTAGLAMALFAFFGGVEASNASAASGRLVVAALAVCPAMSLLGAKRPQHAVWQIIVGSLACVLAMPAATATLLRPGSLPDVHVVSRGFLVLLALAGWVNFLGTRKAAAATLVTLGVFVFVRPFLPGVETATMLAMPALDALASLLVAAGGILAVMSAAGPPVRRSALTAVGSPFLALRETLGSAWALRIAERFDRSAEERGWPCRLHLSGLEASDSGDDTSWHDDAVNCFDSIARRFASRGWLGRHGGRGP